MIIPVSKNNKKVDSKNILFLSLIFIVIMLPMIIAFICMIYFNILLNPYWFFPCCFLLGVGAPILSKYIIKYLKK